MNARNLFTLIVVVSLFCCCPALAQQPNPGVSRTQTPQEKNQQRVVETLLRELGEIIPGGIDSTPQRKASVTRIVETFVKGQGAAALDQIKAQKQVDAMFPPSELVIAALQFSSNNAANGRQTIEAAAWKNPGYPGVFLALARLAINENRNADGLAHLEKAERIMNAGQWSDAEKNHFRFRYLDGLADVKMRYQEWDQAGSLLNEIAQAKPNDPKLLVRQAEIMYRKDNIDESLQLLGKFAEVLKTEGGTGRKPELMLATWLNRDDKVEDAEKWIVAASNKYPNDAEVAIEYANWMVGRERYNDAQAAIKKIVEASGETTATKFIKGKIAFAQEDYGLAESYFAELTLQEPGNFELANLRALALVESGTDQNKQRALQLAQRNVQLEPKNGVALGILGWVYYQLGDQQQAEGWLNRASQTGINSAEINYFVGRILSDQGLAKQAQTFIEDALKQKGVFLYRKAATRLLERLKAAGSNLPTPGRK